MELRLVSQPTSWDFRSEKIQVLPTPSQVLRRTPLCLRGSNWLGNWSVLPYGSLWKPPVLYYSRLGFQDLKGNHFLIHQRLIFANQKHWLLGYSFLKTQCLLWNSKQFPLCQVFSERMNVPHSMEERLHLIKGQENRYRK
jgi:hypothetical protein